VHHLTFSLPDAGGVALGIVPGALPGVLPGDRARQVVESTDNLGTRLVLLDGAAE
jgi:hypothetical protein